MINAKKITHMTYSSTSVCSFRKLKENKHCSDLLISVNEEREKARTGNRKR